MGTTVPVSLSNPFRSALGPAFESLHPSLRLLHSDARQTRRFRGVTRRLWRPLKGVRGWNASLVLRLCARGDMLFPETGEGVEFDVLSRLYSSTDGEPRLEVRRRFHFPGRVRRFDAVYRLPRREAAGGPPRQGERRLECLSARGRIETELRVSVEDGALRMRSGRMRLRLCGLRVFLPRLLSAELRVRVASLPRGYLGVSLSVANPLLGEFFGFEGAFRGILEAVEARIGKTCAGARSAVEWSAVRGDTSE